VYALLVKTKRNRRDMATMRSLGLTGRQATRAHLFHGGLAAAVTVVVAVPLSVIAAALTWRWVAEYMGAVARAVTSIPTTATIAAATIAVGIVVAQLVGFREQRTPPSEQLHTE
jgi:ABC-type lipoprotein release transport system permease subunit